ncbi:uncharacterized protein [Diadema antillarum]|uniref:uncharacterized protein n=1 Tax=Diadema antillarum TaxID=105358 RepID=UPI003A870925
MTQLGLRTVDDAQGRKHGPLSGPALSIISSNIEGLTGAKQDLLADLCTKHSCDILCLQETHRGPSRVRPRISGMTLIAERPHDQYGSAVFLRNGLSADKISISDTDNTEIITINTKGVSVSSVYKPPSTIFDIPPDVTSGRINVVIGDFNSHHVNWGYAETNEDGELVESWADSNQLSLIHDAKLPPSFNSSRWRRGYNPDLIFTSSIVANQCEKIVLDPIPHTQHRPIGLKITAVISPRAVPFRRRFNLKKADWKGFSDDLDSAILDLPATPDNYDAFVESVKSSSRHNIPRGCRTRYIQGLTDDSKALYDDYILRFEDDPFSDDTIELGEALANSITEERRKKWQELIESTDMTHSSRKAWKTIRILGNDYTKPQPRPQKSPLTRLPTNSS